MRGLLWMRSFGYILFALFFSIFSIPIAGATDSLVMPAKGDTCRPTRMDADHAAEESEWRCPGPSGFSLKYYDSTTQGGIVIGFHGKDLPSDGMTWAPANSGISSRVEWRLLDGMPVAAIVGRWRLADEQNGSNDSAVEELLVIKVTPTGACAIAVIGGLSPQAMDVAREHAELNGPSFRCKIDRPFTNTNPVSDAVRTLDGRFSTRETLEHNGSIVELQESRAGAIEIRYREPRTALAMEPGTLLFRGAEHDGQVKGEAFVFKAGCQPASYEVSSRRENGLLFLEGAAPRRGIGCSLAGLSKSSRHSRLVFEHEPVTTAATAAGVDSLPIERGYYVRSDSPCQQASNATIMFYDGISFGTAHVECRNHSIQKLADGSHQIAEQCRDTQVDGGPWTALTASYAVVSRTEYIGTTPFEKASYRYCKQADLPGPWGTNDLRSLGVK
ncbi:hypothetical protein SAMN05443248_8566 [Bradyrhizobium erythrophlei]|uniref:Uncharacterized protein n=2 Tax=Bradyrhizobium erythrophlei TaxID=1437360 RepID=A0A1M5YP14_9BRAD|nr:hypothetical protein SAMN05443248_8566 [Bradyrhizobium erythrophlei]